MQTSTCSQEQLLVVPMANILDSVILPKWVNLEESLFFKCEKCSPGSFLSEHYYFPFDIFYLAIQCFITKVRTRVV